MKIEKEQIDYIINRCKKGESKAYNEIYAIFGRELFGIALRYSKDTLEAEDILQDSFIKIFDKISHFEHTGSFEGWLKKIVVNTAINKFNKNKSLKEDYNLEKINDTYDETITSELTTMELLAIIQELPEGYRNVFNLYIIEGYNHKEIAEMLQISEGTSKSQLSKAKGLLRKKLTTYNILN